MNPAILFGFVVIALCSEVSAKIYAEEDQKKNVDLRTVDAWTEWYINVRAKSEYFNIAFPTLPGIMLIRFILLITDDLKQENYPVNILQVYANREDRRLSGHVVEPPKMDFTYTKCDIFEKLEAGDKKVLEYADSFIKDLAMDSNINGLQKYYYYAIKVLDSFEGNDRKNYLHVAAVFSEVEMPTKEDDDQQTVHDIPDDDAQKSAKTNSGGDNGETPSSYDTTDSDFYG